MAGFEDVVQLPVRFIDHSNIEAMAVSIQRNFVEIERCLALLQAQIKKVTGGAVSGLSDKAAVWDRASVINPDGTIPTSRLTDKLVGLQHELQLANEAVTAAKIAVGAIREYHIKAGEIPIVKTNFPYHQLY